MEELLDFGICFAIGPSQRAYLFGRGFVLWIGEVTASRNTAGGPNRRKLAYSMRVCLTSKGASQTVEPTKEGFPKKRGTYTGLLKRYILPI